MKCTPCGQKAVVHLPAYRLRLCKTCYPAWFEKHTQRTIERLKMFTRQDRVLVAVSGGKDSLGLWHALLKLGYETDGFYIHLRIQTGSTPPNLPLQRGGPLSPLLCKEGQGEVDLPGFPMPSYSEDSLKFAQAYADRVGRKLQVVDLQETLGFGIPEIRKAARRPPCSPCGTIKRHYMNSVAVEGGYAVTATGHNLDDEVATLFSNTLRWDMDYLSRQDPVLPAAEGFARKVKPFCFFSEKETALYARLEGIPYVYDECPFAAGATSLHMKDVVNRLEHDSPGTKRTFLANFLKAKDRIATVPKPEMRPCKECGAMTPSRIQSPSPERSGGDGAPTPAEVCAFCRLRNLTNGLSSFDKLRTTLRRAQGERRNSARGELVEP